MTGRVESRRHEDVVIAQLDNPPLNLLTPAVSTALFDVLSDCEADTSVRCVIITGAGERAFCAGADLHAEASASAEQRQQNIARSRALLGSIERHRVPVIAAINGHCIGAGLELALACDLRIVSEHAKLCAPGVKVGVVVSTARLTRLVGPAAAKSLLLTGRTISGAEAVELGVATASAPHAELLDCALGWAQQIASRAPLAVERTKLAIHEATELPFDEALARSHRHLDELATTADHQTAARALREKVEPKFERR